MDEPLSTERSFPDSSYDLSVIILDTYGDCTASMDPLTTYELKLLFQFFFFFALNLKFINGKIILLCYIDISWGHISPNKLLLTISEKNRG